MHISAPPPPIGIPACQSTCKRFFFFFQDKPSPPTAPITGYVNKNKVSTQRYFTTLFMDLIGLFEWTLPWVYRKRKSTAWGSALGLRGLREFWAPGSKAARRSGILLNLFLSNSSLPLYLTLPANKHKAKIRLASSRVKSASGYSEGQYRVALKQALRIMDMRVVVFRISFPSTSQLSLRSSPRPEQFFQSQQKLIISRHLSPLTWTFA